MISNMDTDYLLFFVSSKLSPELHLLSTKLCRVNQISGGNPIHLLFCINAGLWLLLLCDHKHTHTHNRIELRQGSKLGKFTRGETK